MKLENIFNSKESIIKDIRYKIIKTKEKEDCVVLYLNNNEKINVDVDTYFKFGISSLIGLDEELYKKLKYEEKLFMAYRGSLRKLSTKDFTIKQIKDYLVIKKDLDVDEANILLDKLISYGLLDDDRYCLNRTSYLNKQLLSTKQIKIKLTKEGVSKDLIEKYVINNSEEEYNKANKLAIKYSNSIRNKSLNATKQNILSKIVNLGYSYEAAKQSVDNLNLKSSNELELLKKEYLKAKKKYESKYDNYDLRNHIYTYLINKGFRSEDIKTVMED